MNYSFDELRKMGCPNKLLMQYVLLSKSEVDKIVYKDLYPKYNCPKCYDWFHMPFKYCKCDKEKI